MYGHGGIDFPKLCAIRVNFQVDSVGPIGADVWSWDIYFPKLCTNRVNFQVDSVGPIGADVWSWAPILS